MRLNIIGSFFTMPFFFNSVIEENPQIVGKKNFDPQALFDIHYGHLV